MKNIRRTFAIVATMMAIMALTACGTQAQPVTSNAPKKEYTYFSYGKGVKYEVDAEDLPPRFKTLPDRHVTAVDDVVMSEQLVYDVETGVVYLRSQFNLSPMYNADGSLMVYTP